MVSMLLVRQEVSVQGNLPSRQTFRVKGSPVPAAAGAPAVHDLLAGCAANKHTILILRDFDRHVMHKRRQQALPGGKPGIAVWMA